MRKMLIILLLSLIGRANAVTGDMNGDGQIGLEESIISLQVVTGANPEIIAQASSVRVYDAEDNFLGILIGETLDTRNGFLHTLNIFNPTTNNMLRLNRDNGEIGYSTNPVDTLYYTSFSCQGDVYTDSIGGLMLRVDNHYYSSPFFGRENIRTLSYKEINPETGQTTKSCSTLITTGQRSPVTIYTEAEVGFTFPLSFPLRFDTN